MLKRIQALMEVRKLIALSITGLFIALALHGKMDTKLVEYVVTTVIAFYFAKSTALDSPNIENTRGE
ncbi:hypothetical protein LAV60_15320 [Clostridium sporogenes]|uniref:hypothetical protein n=1 Tax=Clostridium sporogenes TaxID=1509 RepID=UPI00223807A2|nr:hypothetical protein [Clostridium sporogenes]MCW6094540.1 hypothetical protein [Clostridium sporogenes]